MSLTSWCINSSRLVIANSFAGQGVTKSLSCHRTVQKYCRRNADRVGALGGRNGGKLSPVRDEVRRSALLSDLSRDGLNACGWRGIEGKMAAAVHCPSSKPNLGRVGNNVIKCSGFTKPPNANNSEFGVGGMSGGSHTIHLPKISSNIANSASRVLQGVNPNQFLQNLKRRTVNMSTADTKNTLENDKHDDTNREMPTEDEKQRAGDNFDKLLLPSGIPGWDIVMDSTNPKFCHGKHLLHDTLVKSGGAYDIHHFVSTDRNEVVMVCSTGDNVCGHKGIMHGGFLATLFDNVFALLGFVNVRFPVTKELNINYLTPVKAGAPLLAKARIVKTIGSVELPQFDAKGRKCLFFEGALFLQSQFTPGKGEGSEGIQMGNFTPDEATGGKADATKLKPLLVCSAQMIDVGGSGKLPTDWKA